MEQGRLLFNATIQDAWTALPFDKSYEEPEPDKNPWKADISMVECNAGIKVDGQGAKYTFIYFVGVSISLVLFADVLVSYTFSAGLLRDDKPGCT